MRVSVTVLCSILQRPECARDLSHRDWSELIALARTTNLLGTLAEVLHQAAISTGCNGDRHLAGARQLSERQRRSVRWEIQCIHDALGDLRIPVVLLKGAAYVMGGHDNARGRLFGDIDVLVPSDNLADVEIQLMVNGWAPAVTEEYDDHYYRRWMHELPPMAHVRRGTVIDVHHTLLPPTARLEPNPAHLAARSLPLDELPGIRIPSPEDLVVHSIVHLVHEGSVDNGLRDLYDVWRLIEHHAADREFVSRLHACCQDHGVAAPVLMGLALVTRFYTFSQSIPAPAPQRPGFGYGAIAEWLFYRTIAAAGNDRATTRLMRLAIYIRAHWLRMPPALLAKHLAKKLAFRLRTKSEAPAVRIDP